ncbi:MAG: acyltransferase [Myxococcota bacterium]
MFGTFRYVLAHMVVVSHLWRSISLWAGAYAVFGFFLLSGYLMALVLDRTYGFAPRGLARFLGNRALRIYPPFLAVAALAVAVTALLPEATRSISLMRIPLGFEAWARNLLILGVHLDPMHYSRLIPPAWSIDIELCFYVAMALGLARRRLALPWFGASVAYTLYLVATGESFNARYSNLAAASLPYSTGALLYHYREPLRRVLSGPGHAPVALGLFLANAAFGRWFFNVFVSGFYLSLACTAYAVVSLGALDPRRLPRWLRKLDEFLGDLSYPVFLCHWSMAVVVASLGLAEERGAALFWGSLPLVNLCAWGIHRGVEQPLNRLRAQIRRRAPGPARDTRA